jgi:cysteine desulfurase
MKKKIYLDFAATTPLDKSVLKKMMPYLENKFGNASSIHKFGQEASEAIDETRTKMAKFLNCKPTEIVFTGSASESNNLAIRGVIKAIRRKKQAGEKIQVITTKIEHKAVLEVFKDLEKECVKVVYLPVGTDGIINIDDLRAEITPETDLISIMYANNEVGSIQPIKKIGKIISEINKIEQHPIYFHTDAVQAANWLDLDVNSLGVHLLTLSGHKIYGPKGVGILYVKEGIPIMPIILGGSHEWGLRAGTENVAGIVGMGAAISQIKHTKTNTLSMLKLKEKLIKGILTNVRGSKINGPLKTDDQLPNIVNFSFLGVEGESLVITLDEAGFAVSTGSACTSTALMPSHVLIAMGLTDLNAHSSLRISLGKYTTIKEIDLFIKILPKVIEKLRRISGR